MAAVGGDVKGLRLDAGRRHGSPLHVISLQFSVGDGVGLLCDGVDGAGAVVGFLGAGDIGEPFLADKPGSCGERAAEIQTAASSNS